MSDENLVMLVHRELDGWSRLRTEAHLFVCPACRANERRLRSLSSSLAVSMSNPSLGFRTFQRPKTALWASLGLGVLSAGFLGWQLAAVQLAPTTNLTLGTRQCGKGEIPVMKAATTKCVQPSLAVKSVVPKPPVRRCDR